MTPNIDDAKARLREVAAVNTQHELGRAIATVLDELERLQAAMAVMNSVSKHQSNYVFPRDGHPLNTHRVHPLTCGNNSRHTILFPFYDGSKIILRCADCDYVQVYASPLELSEQP